MALVLTVQKGFPYSTPIALFTLRNKKEREPPRKTLGAFLVFPFAEPPTQKRVKELIDL